MNLSHTKVDFTKVSDIVIPEIFYNRIQTGDCNMDSIFGIDGAGILPGSTITLVAPAGCGKSTFTLTLGEILTKRGYRVGYTSGEENDKQLAFTCRRLNVSDLMVSTETDVDILLEKMDGLDLLIVDSYQCLTESTGLNRNKKNQYIISNFVKKAKDVNCAVLFIVQLTTSGDMRGGSDLAYATDVNIRISKSPEHGKEYRIFDVYKNRFGNTIEHGANLTANGYEFLGDVITPVSAENVSEKKLSKSEQRKLAVLDMTDPPHITMARVMNTLDIQKQTAYIILRELEADNKIVKYGRGDNAIWKLAGVPPNLPMPTPPPLPKSTIAKLFNF